MNRRQPLQTSEQVHQSVAVRELIGPASDYDTSTSAWSKFDKRMTRQLAALERRMRRYFTPVASGTELGR
jgi:hypothetical protein